MGESIKVTGRMANNTVKDIIKVQMDKKRRENGEMVRE
jgi:hypothetical protein